MCLLMRPGAELLYKSEIACLRASIVNSNKAVYPQGYTFPGPQKGCQRSVRF